MGRLLEWGGEEPGRDFDCRPFMFRHALGGEPLLSPARLAELAARAASGPLVLDDESDQRAFLGRCEAELRQALPALGREGALTATVVRRAPGSAAGFEIDPASGFILALDGVATVRIFDGAATGVPSAYDLERFYQRGGPSLGEALERRAAEATVFRLGPGSAFHQPRHAPYAVTVEGDGAALELRLAVMTRAARREVAAHRVNAFLRVVGVDARAAGRWAGADRIKQVAGAVGHLIRPLVDRVAGSTRD